LVGRDSQRAFAPDAALAALYSRSSPDESLAIKFCRRERLLARGDLGAEPGAGIHARNPAQGQWQGAADCLRTVHMLSSYYHNIEARRRLQLVASTDVTLSGSPNTRLTAGLGSGSDWQAGNWSVGRGLWNGGHAIGLYGFIDEVRISGSALGRIVSLRDAYRYRGAHGRFRHTANRT